MIAQIERHKVTDHAIPAGTEAASRLLSSFSGNTKSTSRQYVRQASSFSACATGCAGLCVPPGGEPQEMADRPANDADTNLYMANLGS
jgi:hypothetical protein